MENNVKYEKISQDNKTIIVITENNLKSKKNISLIQTDTVNMSSDVKRIKFINGVLHINSDIEETANALQLVDYYKNTVLVLSSDEDVARVEKIINELNNF